MRLSRGLDIRHAHIMQRWNRQLICKLKFDGRNMQHICAATAFDDSPRFCLAATSYNCLSALETVSKYLSRLSESSSAEQ